jgi:hypothetical protein
MYLDLLKISRKNMLAHSIMLKTTPNNLRWVTSSCAWPVIFLAHVPALYFAIKKTVRALHLWPSVLESQGTAAAACSYLPISHHCRRMPRTAAAALSPWSALAGERPPTRPRGRCSLTPHSRHCPVIGAPQHRSLPFATAVQPANIQYSAAPIRRA